MIQETHPFFYLRPLFEKENAIFQLSKYEYLPDTLLDKREIINVSGDDLNLEWLERQINSLAKNQELAFHSNIKIIKKTFDEKTSKEKEAIKNYHIPMIDFAASDLKKEEFYDRLRKYIPAQILRNMFVFSSGRSYHIYSTTLLSPKKWQEFMARLLLVNQSNDKPIVDNRWIGHRLYAGYSSLRWSNNSGLYKKLPEQIRYP